MSKYNVIQGIYKSFYSPDFYRDVGANWGGKAFFYLFFLLALSWIGQTFIIQTTISHLYQQGSEAIIKQIPVITIKDGVASTPSSQPYVIKDMDGHDKVFAVIDTSDKEVDINNFKGTLLLTKDKLITRPKANEVRVYEFPKSLNATLDPTQINSHIESVIGYAWIAIFILALLTSYIYRIVQVLLYAIIGKIFSLLTGSRVFYGKILQITMVALTPAIILASVLDLCSYTLPNEDYICFGLTMLYMAFGILVNRKKA